MLLRPFSPISPLLAIFVLTVGLLVGTDGAFAAQPQGEATGTPGDVLSKLVERPSALVVDIDVSKLDVNAAFAWVTQRAGAAEENHALQAPAQMAGGLVESLKTAGVKHLYVLVPTRVINDGGPLVVIPCSDVAAVEGLAAMLLSTSGADSVLKIHKRPGLVLVGPQKVVDRLDAAAEDAAGDARNDLLQPLSDPQRKDHLAVFSLADAYRQELVAIWPDSLPADAPLQLSPRQLASDIQRITLSWNLPPEVAVDVTVEAVDVAAAERVEKALESVLTLVSAHANEEQDAASVAAILKPQRDGEHVKLQFNEASIDALLAQAKGLARITHRSQSVNHLKQIGLAIHNYHDTYRHFPPKYFIDRQGQPLVSWRVAILPYIEQQALYQSLKLDQPWNAAANAKFSAVVIPTYADEGGDDLNKTRFRVPVFPGSAWDGEGPPKTFQDITDGTSNTIAVIHAPAEAAVSWADPAEWKISPDDPMKDVFGDREEVAALFFDGSVRTLQRNELDNKKLSAMLTIAGGEVIE